MIKKLSELNDKEKLDLFKNGFVYEPEITLIFVNEYVLKNKNALDFAKDYGISGMTLTGWLESSEKTEFINAYYYYQDCIRAKLVQELGIADDAKDVQKLIAEAKMLGVDFKGIADEGKLTKRGAKNATGASLEKETLIIDYESES